MLIEHEILESLDEKEQARLARTHEARTRGIDVVGSCRTGHVVAVRDRRGRIAGFMARHHCESFNFLHSAIFTPDVANVLYEHAFRAAVQDTVALFLALADNQTACRLGARYGAFQVGLDMLDEIIPEFVDTIRGFPPGGYYRAGDELRNVHDTPEQKTVIYMVTRMSFRRAERQRLAAAQRQRLREAAEQQLSLAL